MKLKTPYVYGLANCGKGLAVAYGVVLLANFLIMLLSMAIMRGTHLSEFFRGMLFGMNVVNLSWFFMLVFGAVMYKQSLLFFVQNGRSRKIMLIASLLIFITWSVALAFVNMIFDVLGTGRSSFYGMLMMNGPRFSFVRLVWETVMLLCVSFLGMFIAAVFVRLTKFWRILLGVGIPVVFFIAVPAILRLIHVDATPLMTLCVDFFLTILGFSNTGWHPWTMTATITVVDVVLCGGMYLVLRKTTIRK